MAAEMSGGTSRPAKPVSLTFDDGFANQLEASKLLRRYHVKATFYIITAVEASRWCIGAGRRNRDPLQPPSGCGDSYLSSAEVKMLDRIGLCTSVAHTVPHQNLPAASPPPHPAATTQHHPPARRRTAPPRLPGRVES